MKISFWQIIADHLSTLRNDISGRLSLIDLIIFYALPVVAGIIVFLIPLKVSKDFYIISVSFFGIFVALLLNFQVAAFGIYNRKWISVKDEKVTINREKDAELKRRLLNEVNSNISYLILVSIDSILLFVLLYTSERTRPFAAAVSWTIYSHFALNLLMVVKRSHILFRKEYDEIQENSTGW